MTDKLVHSGKIIRTIKSCVTSAQIKCCERMLTTYLRFHGNGSIYYYILNLLNDRKTYIRYILKA